MLAWIVRTISEIPKTSLRFRDLIGGPTDLSKADIPLVLVHSRKGIEINIRQGKRGGGRVQERSGMRSL